MSKVLIRYGEDNVSVHNAKIDLEVQLQLDPLTDLFNRRAYNEFIPQAINRARSSGKELAIAELDIDDFKRINDLYGHAAGDMVLLRLADIIRKTLPDNAHAFRIGGEEFVLLFEGYGLSEAAFTCENLVSQMRSTQLPEADMQQVTISCGVAAMSTTINDPASLFHAADEALYTAKAGGKNRVALHSGTLDQSSITIFQGKQQDRDWVEDGDDSARYAGDLVIPQQDFSGYANRVYDALAAAGRRSKTPSTLALVQMHNEGIFAGKKLAAREERLFAYLQAKARPADLVFRTGELFQWLVILPASGQEDAQTYLKEVFSGLKAAKQPIFRKHEVVLHAGVAEVSDSDVHYESILSALKGQLLSAAGDKPWQISLLDHYSEPEQRSITVSVLEEDDVFRNLLKTTVEDISSDAFKLKVNTFRDGYEFLSSNWYMNEGDHLLIMNDILPRQTGLDVLHSIRKLPGNKRFLVFMMTERKSEDDMVYGIESGADKYLVKPINLRMLQVDIKRMLERHLA